MSWEYSQEISVVTDGKYTCTDGKYMCTTEQVVGRTVLTVSMDCTLYKRWRCYT